MPQLQLPFFPHGATEITPNLAIMREEDQVTYIYGHMPVFTHDVKDIKTFRMYTSQLYVNGSVKQSEIAETFGVAKSSVKRGVKVYREKGPGGFYEKRKGRGSAILTGSTLEETQQLLDEGKEIKEVAERLGIKKETIRKGIESKRLHAKKK